MSATALNKPIVNYLESYFYADLLNSDELQNKQNLELSLTSYSGYPTHKMLKSCPTDFRRI